MRPGCRSSTKPWVLPSGACAGTCSEQHQVGEVGMWHCQISGGQGEGPTLSLGLVGARGQLMERVLRQRVVFGGLATCCPTKLWGGAARAPQPAQL